MESHGVLARPTKSWFVTSYMYCFLRDRNVRKQQQFGFICKSTFQYSCRRNVVVSVMIFVFFFFVFFFVSSKTILYVLVLVWSILLIISYFKVVYPSK